MQQQVIMKSLLNYLTVLVSLVVLESCQARVITGKNGLKTNIYVSPKFVLGPGSVANKEYYGIDFPKGHIAIKSFNAEVVDERGNSVPLHETYLHHWILLKYYIRKDNSSDFVIVGNSGLCDGDLQQYFGLGAETRGTATDIPGPYGIEVGNPGDVPDGYEEKWLLNVHAIDTRGVQDRWGCSECRCDLYNVTIAGGYKGGLRCCNDEGRCRLKPGFKGETRGLYLRYNVTYVDWNASIIPLEIYIIDVTDMWKRKDGLKAKHSCLVEYDVDKSCTRKGGCSNTKSVSVSLPRGGDVIYGVGHQHTGGTGITLYGEGGREICSSIPRYGSGNKAGNESGYVVGMSTCYPTPAGSVKVSAGEKLTLVSNYSSARTHTGVMSLFYILVSKTN